MNIQELFEKIEGLNKLYGETKNYVVVDDVLDLVKQLDKPQKTVVPQFAADFIAEQKKLGHTLSYSIDACMSDRVAEWYWDNSELFVRAWLDGYDIEKEKTFTVKAKNVSIFSNYLNFSKGMNRWVFSDGNETESHRVKHTKKELQEGGFGEVFNSPLFEVEAVEE